MTERGAGEQGSSAPGPDGEPADVTEDPAGRHAAPDEAPTRADSPPDAETRAVASPESAGPAEPETQVVAAGPPAAAGPSRPTEALTRVAPAQTREAPVPPVGGGARVPERTPAAQARRVVRRVLHAIATALRAIGMVCALILLVHVVLTVTVVNPENTVAAVIAELADVLVLRFRDLFLPADPVAMVAVNYGLAALFWAVAGSVAARVVRALAAVLR